jgi:regulator of cell morphogenesis and NO signaling
MITTELRTATLKELVTQNFQTAAVFEKYSLDFCCRGGKTIDEACKEKGIDVLTVLNELSTIEHTGGSISSSFKEMQPDMQCNYIVDTHHAYVSKMIPVLYAHTQKVAAVHGANHPEVIAIAKHFETVAIELQQHMKKEEQMLFPFIKALHAAVKKNEPIIHAPFGTVQNPIRMMEAEHQNAGDEMFEIRSLSSNYTPPADGCTTYRITYQELQDFERDLHEHVHLENNILFPAAVRLEQAMISKN